MKTLEQALEYLDRGWSIIPINPETKRPAIKWQAYQTTLPTEEDVIRWWTQWPEARIAIITGELSGIVVVDCDNPDALHAAFDAGMRSPVKVKTKRGTHLYFLHPRDGVRRGPRAGINSRGADWPRIPGLDFRGDGSYAVMPPSNDYSWDIAIGHDFDDMPVWEDWKPEPLPLPLGEGEFDFNTLDLSHVTPLEEYVSEWDRTAKFVKETFPSTLKIPTGMGNGRNERVMRYASECIMDGYFGAELRMRCHAFEREFFADPLRDTEFEATMRSMEQAEKRNHPERFDDKGEYVARPDPVVGLMPVATMPKKRRLIQMKDADELIARAEATQYLIEPWLRRGTIVQVYGYSGHGKSLFVQHALSALAAGQKYFGPFEIHRTARVLYLDFEMGRGTIGVRLSDMRAVHGDTQDRLQVWAPFLEEQSVSLHQKEGIMLLQSLVEEVRPDVVVIDTIRSAWPGLKENNAEDWAKINTLAMKLRNAGLGVILVHHSNKPGEGGMGREAGSTNQLTVIENQLRVAQVYEDEETANQNAAIWDGSYDRPTWPLLRGLLPPDFSLFMVMEIRYGKVREWTDAHDRVQWIGFGQSNVDDRRCIVSSRSSKQKAKDMSLDGHVVGEIAEKLGRPIRTIRSWLEL